MQMNNLYSIRKFRTKIIFFLLLFSIGISAQNYSTVNSFDEVMSIENAKYFDAKRITSPGIPDAPTHNGFFFYNCSPYDGIQYDPSGRYMLNLQISIEGRIVLPTDTAYVGIIDIKNNYKLTTVGTSTAWNWQQGCRLQWIPGSSDEFFWNDRSDDGKSLVCRIYNMKTGKTRMLPLPIYTISPDGVTGLTHDFERMIHKGTNYVGIEDKGDNTWAPKNIGIYKVNIVTGEKEMIISLDKMADIMYGDERPSDDVGILYFFREGWNPSGTRFIAFVKDVRDGESRTKTYGYSMTSDGTDIKYLYSEPSHHYWIDDETIFDNGDHIDPEDGKIYRAYFLFKDDGSGEAKRMYFKAPNGHDSFHKSGDWILTDTYNLDGYQYMYMYHIATKVFVPLAKLEFRFHGELHPKNAGIFRVDNHPRFSPDGRTISFDSTHEGLGRQMYVMDIGDLLDNPPVN